MAQNSDHKIKEENEEAPLQIFESIKKLLDEKEINYRQIVHEPTYTSEESAKARNEDLEIGGKAILMKVDETFYLFVLSASKKIDSKKVKEFLKAKKIRFSTSLELYDLCKLVPGSVPPFGYPILPVKIFFDKAFTQTNEKIAFNAGSLTRSLILNLSDYLKAANPQIFDFSQ